jgi:hypothetical protein
LTGFPDGVPFTGFTTCPHGVLSDRVLSDRVLSDGFSPTGFSPTGFSPRRGSPRRQYSPTAVLSDGVPHEGLRGVVIRFRCWLVSHEAAHLKNSPA